MEVRYLKWVHLYSSMLYFTMAEGLFSPVCNESHESTVG